MRNALLLLFCLFLTACASQGKTGEIRLDSPPDGAIIYSSALLVSGTAEGVNERGFIITVTGPDGEIIIRKDAPERSGAFRYELVHGYSGDMLPVALTLTAADALDDPPYAAVNVSLASIEHRPEGAYVDLIIPQPGEEIGGDEVIISGRASGITENRFTVTLIDSNATVIDSAEVILPPAYIADDLPWSVVLDPGEAGGSVLLRITAADGTELNLTPVILSEAAG